MLRVIVCEDDRRFRQGLVKLLHALGDFRVREAADGESACEVARTQPVDLVLLDLELPGMDGIEVVRQLRQRRISTEIIILTTFADEQRLFEAMRAGAAGYLVKGISGERLRKAIDEVMAGGVVLDTQLARRFWNHFAASAGQTRADYGLTPEEIETLQLVARGLSTPEVASALGSTTRGIKAHLESIYRRMQVHSRVEAVVKALQAGVLRL
jgi:NarL family two-component system response regulator LiaR